ncbi:MAG: PIN domain-containing protein [Candidatus Micrarchaeota archaeon]|nr:PIN domain-containing protein [Candidatus Micrarchaeota archaeon]
MRLVVDTNRLMAALIKDSVSRKIIRTPRFEFYSLAILRQDIAKYQDDLLEKSGLNLAEFGRLADSLFRHVSLVDETLVQTQMAPAKAAMDSVDPGDTPFLAAALAIHADGIWSDDRHFERQTLVPLFKTKELLRFL